MKIRLFGLIECDGLRKRKRPSEKQKIPSFPRRREFCLGGWRLFVYLDVAAAEPKFPLRGNDGGWVWDGGKVSGCLGEGQPENGEAV